MSLPEDIKQSIALINNLNTRNVATIIALNPATADIVVTRSVDDEDYFVDINGRDAVMLPVLILELVCEAHKIVVPSSRRIIDVVDAIAEAKYIPPKPQQHYLPPTAAAPTSRVGTTLELNMNDEMSQLSGFGSQLEDGQSQKSDEIQQPNDPDIAANMEELLICTGVEDKMEVEEGTMKEPSKPPPPPTQSARAETLPLSWELAKDGLGIDSVGIHFCPHPSSIVNLVQLFEADGPCGWYINSGCAAENGVVCVNTRGALTFYARYFCVYAQDSLQIINLFQNDFNVYGVSIAAAVNGSFVDWEKVDEKATYSVRGKSINLPEYQLLREVNYFMLFGPDDIETLFKKYPDIKAKNSKWTTKHSTMIKGLSDRKKNNFCSKGMAHWNSTMSQRRYDFLTKFEKMELNLQLESLGSDGKLVVGIMNERHKIIVGKEEGYEEKMY